MFKGFLKYEKLNSKIKWSNYSYFVIFMFAILKFRSIGRSTFRRSKFWAPPSQKMVAGRKKCDCLTYFFNKIFVSSTMEYDCYIAKEIFGWHKQKFLLILPNKCYNSVNWTKYLVKPRKCLIHSRKNLFTWPKSYLKTTKRFFWMNKKLHPT